MSACIGRGGKRFGRTKTERITIGRQDARTQHHQQSEGVGGREYRGQTPRDALELVNLGFQSGYSAQQ